MQDERIPELEEDERLRALLKLWTVPAPRAVLDDRVVASLRAHRPQASFWRRLWTASIPVPVPVACAVMLIVIGGVFVVWHRFNPIAHEHPAATPVIEPAASPSRPEKAEGVIANSLVVEKNKTTPSPQPKIRAGFKAARLNSTMRAASARAAYWTELNLTGFKPAEEIKVSIIKRTSAYEWKN